MPLRRVLCAPVCASILLLGSGCSPPADPAGSNASTSASATSAGAEDDRADRVSTTMGAPEHSRGTLVATANGPEVAVFTTLEGEVADTFPNPTSTDVPATFMVISQEKNWVEVQLPIRPHGGTGWVRAKDVELTEVSYSLKVSTADRTLDLYRFDELMESFPVATGTGGTPTPKGTFYLTELITPTNEGYGPFAYGVSAFSEELTDFGGGPGQIGLHGTDDQESLGRAASHGCIRMSNPSITKLSALLPLGTPIEIS
ncbi:MAG: L,D-transpeptidase [Ornithinimicrobium sp.]